MECTSPANWHPMSYSCNVIESYICAWKQSASVLTRRQRSDEAGVKSRYVHSIRCSGRRKKTTNARVWRHPAHAQTCVQRYVRAVRCSAAENSLHSLRASSLLGKSFLYWKWRQFQNQLFFQLFFQEVFKRRKYIVWTPAVKPTYLKFHLEP